jgi:stress response protein YsnF
MVMVVVMVAGLVALLPTGVRNAAARDEGEDASQRKLELGDCPAIVRNALLAEAKGAAIKTVTQDVQEGVAWYKTQVSIRGRHYDITVDEEGRLIEKVLGNEEERKVKLSDCPEPVRQTLREEAEGAAIDTVEKDTQNGDVSYTAGVKIHGDHYTITVGHDGVLIEKRLDEEEGDEGPGEPGKVVPVVAGSDV